MGDSCYQALESNADKCLVRGKNGEMFANFDCIAQIESTSKSMFDSCQALTNKDPNRKETNNQHDLYIVNRESASSQLQNIQTKYQDCCKQNNRPNAFDRPDGYVKGDLPKCNNMKSQQDMNPQLSYMAFKNVAQKFDYSGNVIADAKPDESCFYGNYGVPIGTQCDMGDKSSMCSGALNKAAMDTLFVPINREGVKYPDRAAVNIDVQTPDLKTKFKKDYNPIRQEYIKYRAGIAAEDDYRYNMFANKTFEENDVSLGEDLAQADLLRKGNVLDYLSAETGDRMIIESSMDMSDIKVIRALKNTEREELSKFIRSDRLKRKEMEKSASGALKTAFKQFDNLNSFKDLYSDKFMLQKARSGDFNDLYQRQFKACDVNDKECQRTTEAVQEKLREIDAYENKDDILQAVKDSVAKQQEREAKPYEIPRYLYSDGSKNLDKVYNPVSTDDADNDNIAYMAGQLYPM